MAIKLDRISEEIDNISQTVEQNVSEENRILWNNCKQKLQRAITLFGGKKNFIIVTGMLKAGKSTLIDLLSRTSKASIVGFGVDTTLRPVVIKMSDDNTERIKVYYKPDELDWEKAMQEITDSLRQIKEYTRPINNFNLTEDNLKNILCRKPSESENCLTQEPLLVIVEIAKNDSEFFKNDCILLDMPGLDSGFSQQSSDPQKYKAFFDECDLLLFVQSSVAPINDKAGEYLKYIGLTRDESTYRLIQNVMNAKYWLKSEETDKEQQYQAEKGKEVFKEKLNKGNVEITPVYVNLGMAYDAILGDKNKIETKYAETIDAKKDDFLKIEQGFINDIKNNGEYRHFAHCKDVLKKEIEYSNKEINKQIQDIDQKTSNLETEKKQIEEKIAIIKKSYENYSFPKMQFALSKNFVNDLNENIKSEFKKLRLSADYKDKIKLNPEDENTHKLVKCKASIANEFLGKCISTAKNFAENFFKDAYIDNLVYIENDNEKNAIEFAQDAIKEKADNLKDHNITLKSAKISANVNKIEDLGNNFIFEPCDIVEYDIKRNWLFIEKKIDFDLEKKYTEIINHYKNQLEKLISKGDGISRRLTNLVKNAIKEDLQPQQSELETELEKKSKLLETLRNDKIALKNVIGNINDLKQIINLLEK